MIPKIIHYCWFGGNSLPDEVKKYIESWKKYLPDYKIIEWNENNFDVNCCNYIKEAYEAKKWAFVSDYVRVNVMYHYGGIYFDTDIEVLKDFSEYLENKSMVLGFESETSVMTAFFALEKNNSFIKDILEIYNEKAFLLANGKYDVTPNPVLFTTELQKYGLIPNGKTQEFADSWSIFAYDYFSAYNIAHQKFDITDNTYIVHHCVGSWLSSKDKLKQKIKSILLRIISEDNFEQFKKKINYR